MCCGDAEEYVAWIISLPTTALLVLLTRRLGIFYMYVIIYNKSSFYTCVCVCMSDACGCSIYCIIKC